MPVDTPNDPQQPKWIMQSKTFAGIIISAGGAVASMLGWEWWGKIPFAEILNQLFILGGLAWATIGRMKAKGPATITPPK